MTTFAIIVAAGRGTRAGGEIPKQWQELGGKPVATHAMETLATHPGIDGLILILHPKDAQSALWPRTPPR